jgi:hypothetical protein
MVRLGGIGVTLFAVKGLMWLVLALVGLWSTR